jgi:hypothetical protein
LSEAMVLTARASTANAATVIAIIPNPAARATDYLAPHRHDGRLVHERPLSRALGQGWCRSASSCLVPASRQILGKQVHQ